MNHAAHASNMLRTAAQKKKQQSSRNTAHVTVTSNYEKFAQQFSKDHGTKSQPTDQSSHQQQQLQQPRSHYRRASSRLPEVDDPEAEQLWDDDDELEGLSAEHPSKARLAYDRWVSKNRRIQPNDNKSKNGPTPTKTSKKGKTNEIGDPCDDLQQQQKAQQDIINLLTASVPAAANSRPSINRSSRRGGRPLPPSESTTTLLSPEKDDSSTLSQHNKTVAASAAKAADNAAAGVTTTVTIERIPEDEAAVTDGRQKPISSSSTAALCVVKKPNHVFTTDVINEGPVHRRRARNRIIKDDMPTARGASAANRGPILDDDAYDVSPALEVAAADGSCAGSAASIDGNRRDKSEAIALRRFERRNRRRNDDDAQQARHHRHEHGVQFAADSAVKADKNKSQQSGSNRAASSASSSSSAASSSGASGSYYESDCSASDVENQLQSNRALSASPSKKAAEAAALYERQNASANVVLYVGLGMVSIGLIITFVGVGEKGFSASELKMVGPSLVGAGVFFCFLRVFFCTCPHCCRKHCCCQFPCCIQREGPDDGGRKREGREDEDGVLRVAARRPSAAHANDFATKSVTGGAAGPSTSTAYHQPRALPSSAGAGSRSNPSARPRTSQQHAAATIAAALEEGTAVDLTAAVVTDDPGRNRPRARRHSDRNSRKNRPVAIKNDDDDDDDLEDILGDEASGATPSVPPPDYYAGVPKFPTIPSPSVSGSRMNIPEEASSGPGSNFGDTAGGGSSSSFHSATPDVEAVAIAPLSPAFPQQQPTTSSSNKTTSSSGVVLSASALEAP